MANQIFNSVMNGPADDVVDITTSDSTDQNPLLSYRGFMVTAAGDVSVVTKAGTTVTIPGCVVGTVYPIGVSRFRATGTTATGIKGLV